jgi:quercetin dioxygenase-like cupin family protein
MDDQDLNRLLREWTAPDAPPGLRPPRAHSSWLRWLVGGTIRVPVPAALAAALLTAGWVAWTPRPSMPQSATPQSSARRPSGELARYPLTGSLQGYDAVIVELNFRPGVSVPEHRHPGPIAGYVIDGRMKFSIDHQPDKAVPAGSTFFEPRGALHTSFGSADPDEPVRIVAFLVVPNGSPLTERAAAQTPPAATMPYVAVHKPEFEPAS